MTPFGGEVGYALWIYLWRFQMARRQAFMRRHQIGEYLR